MSLPAQLRVLVVDDEAPIRQIAAAILQSAGYAVWTAADSIDALHCAEEHKDELDLLLTDLLMPKVDGLELAKRVLGVCPRTRVLLMSGYSNMLAQAKATHWPFLAKPFGMEGLLKSVSEALSAGPGTASQVA